MNKEQRCAPHGLYRLTGHDQYDYSDYHIDDFDKLDLALQTLKKQIEIPNATPTSFSDHYFIYNDKNECLYMGNHDDGVKKVIEDVSFSPRHHGP